MLVVGIWLMSGIWDAG